MSAKMKIGIKNRSHRYDINRLTSSHGHKYSKDKNCLSMMMLLCITQQTTLEVPFTRKLSKTEA